MKFNIFSQVKRTNYFLLHATKSGDNIQKHDCDFEQLKELSGKRLIKKVSAASPEKITIRINVCGALVWKFLPKTAELPACNLRL